MTALTTLRHSLLAACLAAGFATGGPAGAAEPAAPPAAAAHGHDTGFGGHGPGAPGPDMPYDGMHGGHGLHGLNLSEAQQDKLFALMHAQAPQRREQDKAIHKAHEALRELGQAERFDDARATAITRDLGQAVAAQALAEARLHAQVLALLTPEQRERLRQRHGDGGQRGPRGPDQDGAPARR